MTPASGCVETVKPQRRSLEYNLRSQPTNSGSGAWPCMSLLQMHACHVPVVSAVLCKVHLKQIMEFIASEPG
jgi:hypothetical protein